MALSGHLSDLSLSELIEFFCNQRKTGRLKVLYPQGAGYFYLQSGSVVDARIGVLRGIDAVFYALTLPNAKFEFSGAAEPAERSINQPWTQVVLEGLRRLDEGIAPAEAFPTGFSGDDEDAQSDTAKDSAKESGFAAPGFLSFIDKQAMGSRRHFIVGAIVLAVAASVAAIGVPAGWYSRAKVAVAASSPASPQPSEPQATNSPSEQTQTAAPAVETHNAESAAALAARRKLEKERAKAREDRADAVAAENATATNPSPGPDKPGPKKVVVTVSYDESGRVTQASGGDATALRIARQKRFPAGKAGSATITIPIN